MSRANQSVFTEERTLNLTYKRATIEDIDILTETRIEVLRAANKLSDDIDNKDLVELSNIEKSLVYLSSSINMI